MRCSYADLCSNVERGKPLVITPVHVTLSVDQESQQAILTVLISPSNKCMQQSVSIFIGLVVVWQLL